MIQYWAHTIACSTPVGGQEAGFILKSLCPTQMKSEGTLYYCLCCPVKSCWAFAGFGCQSGHRHIQMFPQILLGKILLLPRVVKLINCPLSFPALSNAFPCASLSAAAQPGHALLAGHWCCSIKNVTNGDLCLPVQAVAWVPLLAQSPADSWSIACSEPAC